MGLNPIGNPNWSNEVLDLLDKGIGVVRDNATTRAKTVLLGLVYGIVIGIAGIAAALILVICLLRGLQLLLSIPFSQTTAVWASYLILGGLFALIGLFLLHRAHQPGPTSPEAA
jgi:hypothetical protein